MEKHRVKVELVVDVEAASHADAIATVNKQLPQSGTLSIRMECWTTKGKTVVETTPEKGEAIAA